MAIQTLTLTPLSDTLAHFNAWGQGISNGILAAGLTKTADTGQINWGTNATIPSTTSQTIGYEVWQFTDALQSTAPVYVRLGYGSNGSQASTPQITVTVGTATNGAGTITASGLYGAAVLTNSVFANSGVWASSSSATLYIDSDSGSSLMIAGWGYAGSTVAGTAFCIERTRNWDGTPNNEGVVMMSQSNAYNAALITANAGSIAAVTYNGFVSPSGGVVVSSSSGVVGGTLYTNPVFTGCTPRLNGPSKHLLGLAAVGDMVPITQVVAVTHYGASHNFVRPTGSSTSLYSLNNSSFFYPIVRVS
jgi:hypothetical protein